MHIFINFQFYVNTEILPLLSAQKLCKTVSLLRRPSFFPIVMTIYLLDTILKYEAIL